MKKIVFLVLALVFLLAGCTNLTRTVKTESNAVLEAQTVAPLDESFVHGINAFGFDAAKLLYDTEQNLALSPVSIELALAMTHAGASGNTADEIKQTLGLDGMSDEQIAAACKSLMWRANTGGMEAANALWLGDSYTFRDEFLDTCTQDFMADALPLIIPGAMDDINAWASEKTHGRIEELLTQELPPETELVLTNALYFLGDWEMPFQAQNTRDLNFLAPGGNVTAPFMREKRYVPYYLDDSFSMISLDFKSEAGAGQYAMAFLLPNDGADISDMLAALDDLSFAQALGEMETQEVEISLPKFEFEYFSSLMQPLQSLGISQAFDPTAADFSAMTEDSNMLYISDVLHKCYIRIDELGAEAAAVTEVDIAAGDAVTEPKIFFANKPFVFAIYSREDGAIAFMGAINDPTQK